MNRVSDTFSRFNGAMNKQASRLSVNVGGMSRMKKTQPPQKRQVKNTHRQNPLFSHGRTPTKKKRKGRFKL
jgi:hypothetical protein